MMNGDTKTRQNMAIQPPAALAGLMVGTLVLLIIVRASLKDVVAP